MRSRLTLSLLGMMAFVLVSMGGCALDKPTQQEVQQVFTAFSNGTSQVTNGSSSTTLTGPPTWTYDYYFALSNGGSITMVLNITSSDNLNNAPTAGESGSVNGSITFTNYSDSSYTFNGTVNFTGGFTTSSATNGDVLFNETYDYTGSLTVSGSGVSSMTSDYSASLSIDTNTGAIVSGPTYSGTVTLNNKYTYNVNTLNTAAAIFNPLKVIR